MTERRRAGGRRRPAPKKKNNLPLIIGGAGLLIAFVGLAVVLTSGDDQSEDPTPQDSGAQAEAPVTDPAENATDPEPSDPEDDLFSASAAGSGEEKDGDSSKPKRVVGRDPKTIDVSALELHDGALYLDEETQKGIDQLLREVERYSSERWDVTKEMKAQARAFEDAARKAKRDPFLAEANRNLKQLNNSFLKSELHKKRADGSLAPKPFVGYVDRPYAVFVQADGSGDAKEVAKEAVDLMQQLKTGFTDYFGAFLDLEKMKKEKMRAANKAAIKIVFLRTHKEYRTYNRLRSPDKDNPGALAHYEPNAGRLVVPLTYGKSNDAEKAAHEYREVLLHEGTHQLMDYFTGTNHLNNFGSMWSDEGVAEYFAGHHKNEDGSIIFGRLNSRIRSLEFQGALNRRMPLVEMVKFSRYTQRKMRDEQKAGEASALTDAVYANGWALVYFLNNFDNGKYKQRFYQIMKRQMTKGDAGMPVLIDTFGDEYDQFFEEFDKYQDWLGVVRKKATVKDGIIPDPES